MVERFCRQELEPPPRHGVSVRSGGGAPPRGDRVVAAATGEMPHQPIPSRTQDGASADIHALSTEMEEFEREDEFRGTRGVRGAGVFPIRSVVVNVVTATVAAEEVRRVGAGRQRETRIASL